MPLRLAIVRFARRSFSSSSAARTSFQERHSLPSFKELRLEHDAVGKILTVRFDREARLNALSEVMGNEVHALCKALQEEPAGGDVRAVVFTGVGRAYSTGRCKH